jgi:hypothetical protein
VRTELQKTELQKIELQKAVLQKAVLQKAELQKAELRTKPPQRGRDGRAAQEDGASVRLLARGRKQRAPRKVESRLRAPHLKLQAPKVPKAKTVSVVPEVVEVAAVAADRGAAERRTRTKRLRRSP